MEAVWGQTGAPEGEWGGGSHTQWTFVLDCGLKQIQCEIKEEIDKGGCPVSQCERNSLLGSYHVSKYKVISSQAVL